MSSTMTDSAGPEDYIYLRNLHLSAIVGQDAWDREDKVQPLVLSLRLQRGVDLAGASDNVEETVSYGQICKAIMGLVKKDGYFYSLPEFAHQIYQLALFNRWGGFSLQLTTILPKGSRRAEGGIGFETTFSMSSYENLNKTYDGRFLIRDLKLDCIIGVNAHERIAKQKVVVNLEIILHETGSDSQLKQRCHCKELVEDVTKTVESSSFETLEALVTEIARVSCTNWNVSSIKVSVEKPSALAFVDGAGVQITRKFSWISGLTSE